MSSLQDIVIIGGGQAAGWAAKTLRDLGYDQRLRVVADETHDFYERPPLSKDILSGTLAPGQLSLFPAELLASLAIDWQRPRRALAIDRQQRQVMLDNGIALAYDRLLIANGCRTRPGHTSRACLRCAVWMTRSRCGNVWPAASAWPSLAAVGSAWR